MSVCLDVLRTLPESFFFKVATQFPSLACLTQINMMSLDICRHRPISAGDMPSSWSVATLAFSTMDKGFSPKVNRLWCCVSARKSAVKKKAGGGGVERGTQCTSLYGVCMVTEGPRLSQAVATYLQGCQISQEL